MVTKTGDKSGAESSIVTAEDCLGCRIVGTGTMGALALYWNHLRMSAPKSATGNRLFFGTMAVGKCSLRYTWNLPVIQITGTISLPLARLCWDVRAQAFHLSIDVAQVFKFLVHAT